MDFVILQGLCEVISAHYPDRQGLIVGIEKTFESDTGVPVKHLSFHDLPFQVVTALRAASIASRQQAI